MNLIRKQVIVDYEEHLELEDYKVKAIKLATGWKMIENIVGRNTSASYDEAKQQPRYAYNYEQIGKELVKLEKEGE